MIAGKSMPADGDAKSFGYVQTYDTKPKRRLFELLKTQGMQPNQQVTFLTHGGADVRELPLYLNPQAEHLIDWFHITMGLTVMNQMARGLEGTPGAEASRQLERLKWFLWHGRVPCPAGGRRSGDGPRGRRRRSRPPQAGEGPGRVRRLHRGQRHLDPELRGALPLWRGHLQRLRRVGGQPGGEQTNG